MTLKEATQHAIRLLKPLYHEDEAVSIARWIISWVTGMNATELITHPQQRLTSAQMALLTSSLNEHITEHKPLQYIFGSVHFLGLDIHVRPPVLIPRPETEFWCSWLIKHLQELGTQPLTILDMCTGSGCIALVLAHYLPNASVYAVDISQEACALARENAQINKANITIFQSDLFSRVPQDLKFDVIVSNPPYISYEEWPLLDESVRQWEDPAALLAQDSGLALLKEIITQSPSWLTENAQMRMKHIPQLVVEIGYEQGKLVQDIFKSAGFSSIAMHQDLFGKDRFVTGELHGCAQLSKSDHHLP